MTGRSVDSRSFLIVATAVHIEGAAVINAANSGSSWETSRMPSVSELVSADAHAVKIKGGIFCNRNSGAAVADDEAAVAGELAIRKYQTRVIHHKEGALCIRHIAGKGMTVQTDHKRAALPNIDPFREGDIIGKVIVERFSLLLFAALWRISIQFASDRSRLVFEMSLPEVFSFLPLVK